MAKDDKEVKDKDVYDGSKEGWGKFERDLDLNCLGMPAKLKLIKGENITMKEDDDPADNKSLFTRQFMKIIGQPVAVQERHTTIAVFQVWLQESQQDLYKWLMTHTKDAAISEATKLNERKWTKTVMERKRNHGADKSHLIPEVEQALFSTCKRLVLKFAWT